jgi:hypothetical protein
VFIYKNTGVLYVFTPDTLNVSQQATTGTAPSTDTPGSSATAPHGKFKYVPNLGGIVFVAQWQKPTFFIKTH